MSEIKGFESALRDLSTLLDKHGVPYMVIGGLANAIWGNPRATLDIDVTIWVPDKQIEEMLQVFEQEYICMVDSPHDFVNKTRVLPVKDKENLRIDVIFGAVPFEKDAIDAAVEVLIGSTTVCFCNAENLILLKIVSDRRKDIEDIKGILKFQREKLDFNYLNTRISELAELLEMPEILEQWTDWKDEIPF